jgi:hypothetical protein
MLVPALLIPFMLLMLYGVASDSGFIEASLGRGIVAVVAILRNVPVI